MFLIFFFPENCRGYLKNQWINTSTRFVCTHLKAFLGAHHFLWNREGHKFLKVPRQYLCDPYLMIKKIYDPPPGAIIMKKYVTPNAHSAENMHFGALSLNKIFIKICSHPIISWFFYDPPISHEKILWPQLFHCPPPHLEENDSPLMLNLDTAMKIRIRKKINKL